MDNKKLMHILLRDVKELESLIEEIRRPGDFDQMDRELLLTRISGIRHLLELAAGQQESAGETIQVIEKPKPEAVHPEKTAIRSAISEQVKIAEGSPQVKKEGEIRIKEPVTAEIIPAEPPKAASGKEEIHSPDQLELKEELVQHFEKQILGEKFTAGKSVNDLLLEKGKSDTRFANLPINNLGNAVTTNDKFLFIRELFDGSADEYNEVVRKIDTMESIGEAVIFLRENYNRWKKNETSLKFIDMVKRRFLK